MTTHGSETPRLRGAQRVRSSIDIDAPIERVWAVVTDPAAFPEAIDWVSEAWTEDGGPLDEGSVYFERGKPGLREGTYRWEVTVCEPPRRTVHYHRSGELEAELELLLEPIDDGATRYTQLLRFRSLPAFRPLGYVLERTVMRRGMQRDFDEMILPNFKRLAEQSAVTA
jgi:uncharacterized protein YndB with AHSA1/START domain